MTLDQSGPIVSAYCNMDGFSRCKTLLQAGCLSSVAEDMLNLRLEMLAIDELPA